MTFTEAYEHLKAGKFMKRDFWNETGDYCALLPGAPAVWKIQRVPSLSAGNCLFSVEDMDAQDWSVLGTNVSDSLLTGETAPVSVQ